MLQPLSEYKEIVSPGFTGDSSRVELSTAPGLVAGLVSTILVISPINTWLVTV